MAGLLKRLEAWAADSPERSRFLVMAICFGLAFLVLLFIGVMAFIFLSPEDIKDAID